MKVLLYSHAFHPSTGGVETVSMQLAEGFSLRGIACKVVTRTPSDTEANHRFPVIRNPNKAQIKDLVRWADIVLSNGASLALQPWTLLYRKPVIWVHVGYQTTCIDGAGWVDGAPAPRTPWASVMHRARHQGPVDAMREGFKLAVRRFVAKRLVTRNVAITRWMQEANPLPRQVQIYNPFPTGLFRPSTGKAPEFDFLYLGRLVSEKGVDTLLRALASIAHSEGRTPPTLLIIGDGPERVNLERLAESLGVEERVKFVGNHTGRSLVEQVARGRIAVVPSSWAEPMGGVAIELMAAGRNVIVSKHGGLAECVGEAGFVFPNGDARALADGMTKLWSELVGPWRPSAQSLARAKDFDPETFIDRYVELLRVTARSPVALPHPKQAPALDRLGTDTMPL
ncbi:glycosyltransferase family 4 protein [Variovorax sp. GT1P44]|uniref:glycosyltransferase family 4 protein n=1 Tax=Variovorax sp. GT1P44 TaxID=3443742 RepID=UPI003F448761